MAVRSSGNSVKAKIFLDTPLQYVAGASHIDLVDLYELLQSPHQYFWRTLRRSMKSWRRFDFQRL